MTIAEQVATYNDERARRVARREAADAIEYLTRIITDLDAGRVPSSVHVRSASASVADVSHGVGQITAYAEIRRAITPEQET